MGANLDFITSHVLGHVVDFDNALIAAALAGTTEEDCDVRTCGGGATTPNWVRFWSSTANSPLGVGAWQFELLGDHYPGNIPPPDYITGPWWQFARRAPVPGVIPRTDG